MTSCTAHVGTMGKHVMAIPYARWIAVAGTSPSMLAYTRVLSGPPTAGMLATTKANPAQPTAAIAPHTNMFLRTRSPVSEFCLPQNMTLSKLHLNMSWAKLPIVKASAVAGVRRKVKKLEAEASAHGAYECRAPSAEEYSSGPQLLSCVEAAEAKS